MLSRSYTVLAPVYDLVVRRALERARKANLAPLADHRPGDVLLSGMGTGLDLPHLPRFHRYTGIDLTPAMLERAIPRAAGRDFAPLVGDSQMLPFRGESFDCTVLHLIVAVVPRPQAVLSEAARVTRIGGTLLVLDKFLAAGAIAPLRRMLSPLAAQIATRTDVVFEPLLAREPRLRMLSNEPALARGWFRRILLERV